MLDCISVENMRASDTYTIANFVPSLELMHRAAYGVFKAVSWQGSVAIVVGSGNNGGDGFALACILHDHGIPCKVFTVSNRLSEDSAYYANQAAQRNIPVGDSMPDSLSGFSYVVDCLLGTGFAGNIQVLTGLYQSGENLEIGDSGPFNGGVFPAGPLHSDSAGGNHNVSASDIQVNSAAGTHTDKGMHAQIGQLFHGDGCRGAADSGGNHADRFTEKRTGIGDIFPIGFHVNRGIEQRGDGLTAAGITGKDAVVSYIAGGTMNMKLNGTILHKTHLLHYGVSETCATRPTSHLFS